MKKTAVAGLTAGLFVALAACAGAPGPGEAGYPFNLSGSYSGQVSVEGQAFSMTVDLRTEAAGVIRGTYEVTSPVSMAGDVTGTLVADTATIRLDYMNPMDGCGGNFEAKGPVDEGGDAFSGRARVNDSCGGFLSGTVRLRR